MSCLSPRSGSSKFGSTIIHIWGIRAIADINGTLCCIVLKYMQRLTKMDGIPLEVNVESLGCALCHSQTDLDFESED